MCLCLVAQSCLTLWDPMDYTVHGILQARILEWVAFPFSKGSSRPRNWTRISCIGKDSDAGRDWGQEEKGTTEDEMAGWHHRLNGCEFEWTPGDGDGQGGLACCDSWGRKGSDTTERLNWTELLHCRWILYQLSYINKYASFCLLALISFI